MTNSTVCVKSSINTCNGVSDGKWTLLKIQFIHRNQISSSDTFSLISKDRLRTEKIFPVVALRGCQIGGANFTEALTSELMFLEAFVMTTRLEITAVQNTEVSNGRCHCRFETLSVQPKKKLTQKSSALDEIQRHQFVIAPFPLRNKICCMKFIRIIMSPEAVCTG
jgi:hypothetical protein